jgi:hypothetical protein
MPSNQTQSTNCRLTDGRRYQDGVCVWRDAEQGDAPVTDGALQEAERARNAYDKLYAELGRCGPSTLDAGGWHNVLASLIREKAK